MNEGQKVLQLLEEHGHNIQDLAKAAGVRWSAAKKYIDAEKIGAGAWETCSKGLLALDIDPALVRPSTARRSAEESLRPLVQDFSPSQLDRVKKILLANPNLTRAQENLVSYIEGVLAVSHRGR